MSCPCKELERRYGSGDCKCLHYREQFPVCECENCSVSKFSPEPVRNDELLIRTVFSPVQINQETGWVDPAHFRYDAMKRGLSVNRKPHISEADLQAKIEGKIARDRAEGKERDDFYRMVTGRCGDIRNLVAEDGSRLFCVYDTATIDDLSHADVCQAVEPPPRTANRKAISKKISLQLFEIFVGEATDTAGIYGGGQ